MVVPYFTGQSFLSLNNFKGIVKKIYIQKKKNVKKNKKKCLTIAIFLLLFKQII